MKNSKTIALVAGAICMFGLTSQQVYADQTPTEKAAANGREVKNGVKKAVRGAKDGLCETVNGKIECAGKKLKHKAQNAGDKMDSGAKNAKDHLD